MDKQTRDNNFWRWQNKLLTSLMNKIEDQTGVLFCDASPDLEAEIHAIKDDQKEYGLRSKMVTYLENLLNS